MSKSILRTINKYFDSFISSNVLFTKRKSIFLCEVSIYIDKSILIKSHAESEDAYGSFGIANEKIKKRIRRYHRKIKTHKQYYKEKKLIDAANEYVIKNPDKTRDSADIDKPVIIAESEEIIRTLSVSEAVMLMNLNEKQTYFFKNVTTKRLNILFKRSDGNIGWLDPKK